MNSGLLKNVRDKLIGLITSRLFIMGMILIFLMILLVRRLFVLQIVNGQSYQDNFTLKIEREKNIQATRGAIYDRNGVKLAWDKLAYSVTIEDNYDSTSTRDMEINSTIVRVIDIIERNGDTLDNDFNITLDDTGTYQFTVSRSSLLRFLADIYGRSSTEDLLIRERNATAEEVMEYLCGRKMFGVGRYVKNGNSYDFFPMEGYPKDLILKIIRIRYAMFSNSYQKYIASNIATGVNEKTVAEIMENLDSLQGVDIAEDTVREYIDDPSMSHILGYTGKISDEELSDLNSKDDINFHHVYELNDKVGKSGIEQVMERQLQGTKGRQTIFVDNLGRVTEAGNRTDPVAGNDLYLTIDYELQSAIYKILEQKIAGIVVSKIRNVTDYDPSEESSASDIIIPIDSVYYALFDNNVISFSHLSLPEAGENEKAVYSAFRSKLDAVVGTIDGELRNGNTPYNDLDDEYKVYESYIYSMLTDSSSDIFRSEEVDDKAEISLQWASGTISLSKYLKGAIAEGWINVDRLTIGSGYSDTDEIYGYLVDYIETKLRTDNGFFKKIYRYMLSDESITGYQVCMVLFEQGIVNDTENLKAQLEAGAILPYDLMVSLLKSLEITPAQLALDPCSGSCVVTDPGTGEVLALVTYPSYNDNMLANSVNAEYYNALAQDKSLPLYDYATQQKTAPGSTFKPISTTAGLEEKVINLGERIECVGVFDKDALSPRCWIYPGHHGELDVIGGIKNSCNYFFYEVGYRLGCGTRGIYNSQDGLEKIRKYCDLYGLTDKSGVEITESEPQVSDQDSVRSAIGQGTHSYTTVQLARYVSTVANKGICYNLSVIDKLNDSNGNLIEDYTPSVRNNIDISSSTWNAIHEGMRQAVTTYKAFEDFPVIVAGKTGTAQQVTVRPNHALFIGFAPFSSPRISVATRIAYGYTSANAAEVTRDVLKYYFKLENEEDIITGNATIPDSGVIGD
ncbi:MAG: penicillin-binding protein [Lachnospiraceae bacterium]|nr:penicillin-binding protein [Lachnospiraceae bacterium]